MTETPSPETEEDVLKARKFLNGIADAFEVQGNTAEAKKYRDLAQRQSVLKKREIKENHAYLDKMRQAEKRNQPDLRPLQPHERADATVVSRAELAKKIKQMLSPSSPITASKPSIFPTGQGSS